MTNHPVQPQFASIDAFCVIVGLSKSTVYQALARGDLKAKKAGAKLLIDVPHGLAWVRSLPDAKVQLRNSRRPLGGRRAQENNTTASP